MEVNGQLHTPADLLPGKEHPVPIGYEAGWASEPVWMQCRREYFLAPRRESNFDHPIVQPVASRYTDWAIPVLRWRKTTENLNKDSH
jgi:hypothetical protein